LDKQSPFERIAIAGYAFSLAGEAIAAGCGDPRQVVAVWMASADSCDAVMNVKFRDLGLGLAVDKTSRRRVWWVANFGKRSQ
jgi:uncharacterized protein YkwD